MKNDIIVNTTLIGLKLDKFNNIEDTFSSINALADMSGSNLKPNELFDNHPSFPYITNLKSNLIEEDMVVIKKNIIEFVSWLREYLKDMEDVDSSNPQEGESSTQTTETVVAIENKKNTFEIKIGFTAQFGNTTIDVKPGKYNIVASQYDKNGKLISITIEVEGKKIKLKVKNGNILTPQEIIGKTFQIKVSFKGICEGKKINVKPGKYNISAYHFDDEGNLVGITIDAKSKKVFLKVKDDKIVVEKVNIKLSSKTITPIEPDDEPVEEIELPGEQEEIVSVIPVVPPTGDGTEEPDNKKYAQKKEESTKKNDEIDIFSDEYEVTKSIKVIVNGEEIELKPGKYKIIRKYYDNNGNLIAFDIEVDGKIITLQVINNKVILPTENMEPKYELKEPITIKVGNEIITILPGKYKIIKVFYNEDGTIKSIYIEVDNRKIWLHFDRNGVIAKIEYTSSTNGVYKIINPNFYIYDMYGNVIGMFKEGQYYIYEVLYDQNGNIIGFRFSPDGEYEKWLYPGDNTQDGAFSFFDEVVNNNGISSISFFEKNKGLLGLLGILFVAFGTTLVLKKRSKKQNENMNTDEEYIDNYTDEEWETNELPSGNYGVYEVKKNKDGLITDARITPDDSEEEYWVEV